MTAPNLHAIITQPTSMHAQGLRYHERRALGYGTTKERLGKDSMGNYSDCSLTLQFAVDPVVTPDGYIFSREAIIENLLAQKKAYKRKLAAYEAALAEERKQAAGREAMEEGAKLVAFDAENHGGFSSETASKVQAAIISEAERSLAPGSIRSQLLIKENQGRADGLKTSFWTPSVGPDAIKDNEKPDPETRCPASGKALKLKDLVAVRFTPANDDPDAATASHSAVHIDPLTKDNLTNASKLVVFKATGDVLLQETYVKLVKPEGLYNGTRIKESEVIELQTGGTGFAARGGDKVQASKYSNVGLGSGKQQLRGQAGAHYRSLGGLVQGN
jgi:nitric oxide synthase-interacting protein